MVAVHAIIRLLNLLRPNPRIRKSPFPSYMLMFLNGVLTSGLFKRLRVRQMFFRQLGSVTGTLPVSAC